jgi:tetratricopeptide (TPR) repeat protein
MTIGNSRVAASALLAVAISCLQAGHVKADASSSEYIGCDGYGAASSSGDGMTQYAHVMLIFNPPGYGTTARNRTMQGSTGIYDCNAALADLPAQHWMRKVSLLRARAMHRIDEDDFPGAMADLDQADAAAQDPANPYYQRSLALGTTLVRAYIARRMGDHTRAETLAQQAFAQRPYNRQVAASVLIVLGEAASDTSLEDALRNAATLVPTDIDSMFYLEFDLGHFDEALTLYTQLTPPHEIGSLNISRNEQLERDWRDFRTARLFWAEHDGAQAYALAALGRADDARAAIKAANDRLAKDTEQLFDPNGPEPKDPEIAAKRRGESDVRMHAAADAGRILSDWEAMVERRIMVSQGKAMEVWTALKTAPLPRNRAIADLLDAITAQLPKKGKQAKSPADMPPPNARDQFLRAKKTAREPGLDLLFTSLPEAETPSRIPAYSETGFFDKEGFKVTKGAVADDVTTVTFRGVSSTASIVEEMALLRAADSCLQSGKTGLVVVGRHDTQFTINTTYYGSTLRSDPDGWETGLDVIFVDKSALPPRFQNAPWRVIDANAVYSALAPLYLKNKSKRD